MEVFARESHEALSQKDGIEFGSEPIVDGVELLCAKMEVCRHFKNVFEVSKNNSCLLEELDFTVRQSVGGGPHTPHITNHFNELAIP